MRTTLLSLFLLFLLIGCTPPTKEFNYSDRNIEITSPRGWAITDEEDLGDGAYYLSIEKDGLTSSGLVTVTWLEDSIDLTLWMYGFESEFKSQKQFKNLKFSDPKEASFNGNEALIQDYTGKTLGIKHTGRLTLFHSNNRSYCILEQGADEDATVNTPGFKRIKKSFRCNN